MLQLCIVEVSSPLPAGFAHNLWIKSSDPALKEAP